VELLQINQTIDAQHAIRLVKHVIAALHQAVLLALSELFFSMEYVVHLARLTTSM